MNATPSILIVIPALNAAETLQPIVRESLSSGFPVVVVDDGSTDATGERAREAGAIVIRHERNRGKGAALKTAFKYAMQQSYSAVISLDADGQHLPSDIPRFVEEWHSSGADLIIGSRRHLFGGMVRRRRAANLFSAFTISVASGVRISDSQSGFRLYSSRLLRAFSIVADGFDAESEIIVRAGRRKLTIRFIPIGLGFVDGVQTSHYKPVSDTLKIAFRVVRTYLTE